MKLALRHYMAALFIVSILLYVPLSNGLALISQNAQFNLDQDTVKKNIMKAGKMSFGKNNLILEQITPQQEQLWKREMESGGRRLDVKGFVELYAPRLFPEYVTLSHASMLLINRLKFIFNQYVRVALKNPDDFQLGIAWPDPKRINLEKIDLNGINAQIKKIEAAQEMLETMRKELAGRWLLFGRHKQVANLLFSLEKMLVATMQKVQKDYRILEKACRDYEVEEGGARRIRI